MREARDAVRLEDRYTARAGAVFMSGIQALVRLMIEQRLLDDARGLDTGLFVSGYPGSPLGGLDGELRRAASHTEPLGIVFTAGLNEELAATAVAGTQLIGEVSGRRRDGVVGMWFGKNPGLDRAADAIRHASLSGTSPLGGAVAIVGDDPGCKSSTIPSSCESMCRSLLMPVLAPGRPAELIELGLHAVAMSRASGLWSALKVVADVADSAGVITLDGLTDAIPPPAMRDFAPPVLLAPSSLQAEQDQAGARLERAVAYARRARLNRVAFEPAGEVRTVLIGAGSSFQVLLRTLEELGVDDAAKDAAGIRLARIGMPWPLDRATARELTTGASDVIVVEEKLPFIEAQLKELLYGTAGAPRIYGKSGPDGRPLLAPDGVIGVEELAAGLARLPAGMLPAQLAERAARIGARGVNVQSLAPLPARTPYFCSGCPHNLSTKAPADQLVGAGIGCHTMVVLDHDGRGNLLGVTQMGGEGAQWLGLEPFCEDQRFVQNIGDGTFHHSGSLAVRAAVAARARITYKLLYNDAVAMTGGQAVTGRMDVPTLTRWLANEGVERVIVIAADPASYARVELDPIAELRDRSRLAASETELAETGGVAVLIYDDRCATEERRMRKRGQLEAPSERVWINERVCEGCGDCGDVSTCLSVMPVETELGRKTRIDQSSCNQDFACLRGDCPSFVVVEPGAERAREVPAPPEGLPEPALKVSPEALVRMQGIGGTGVVTASQVLQMAAHLDGHAAAGLEQIGLAQKGGPVVSDLRFGAGALAGSIRASAGAADVLLGFDLLGAVSAGTLAVLDPERTIPVVNLGTMPTAAMVTGATAGGVPALRARRRLESATRAGDGIFFDAQRLSEQLFGDHVVANMLLVGAAFQAGCLPLSAAAIERAIALNGTAVEKNLAAFAWGRALVAAPESVERATATPAPEPTREEREAHEIVAALGAGGELHRLLEFRVADLIGYQDRAFAGRYAARVMAVLAAARERAGEDAGAITEAYCRSAHRLLAYKDEYEVARLHLDARERVRREREFGADAKVRILLQPPLLRALGLQRKIRVGAWAVPLLRGLRAGRRVRGHWYDPFSHTEVRRVERALIAEYEELTDAALALLGDGNRDTVLALLRAPEEIRGYEQIKLGNVERYRERAQALLVELTSGAPERRRDARRRVRPGGGERRSGRTRAHAADGR
ncbi:MAG TPA: indolepyruvate ferredoxin oxidoreductase family protein [Solirubrobacteraceae bacterium]|nr:indolepyruvate ferredoxin oxidoreductase family protein [Solirubrobacteraceae bacterium]